MKDERKSRKEKEEKDEKIIRRLNYSFFTQLYLLNIFLKIWLKS